MRPPGLQADGATAALAVFACIGLAVAVLVPADPARSALATLALATAAIAMLALLPGRPRVAAGCAVLALAPLAVRLLAEPAPQSRLLGAGALALAAGAWLAGHRIDRRTQALARALATATRQASDANDEARRAAQTAEQALEAARSAQRAVRDRDRFVAAASHDLRQPVHAIGLFVGALKEEISDGRARYLIDRLDRSMVGLDELFHRLLDISRLDAGTIEPRVSVFAVTPLFQTLESRFAPVAEQRGLRLRVRAPRACSVRSDPALLIEILMNLLSNAFRYTERGGILLGARRRGDRLLIEVRDSGIGIAERDHETIFREFVQLGRSARDRRHGLGLGLAIVRRLASVLDCPVQVRSSPGHGSVFSIAVPLSADAPPAVESPTAGADAHALHGMLVLVVDDEMDILVGMEAILVSWGCFVILARTIDEARRHLSEVERFPDLLISDHRLADGGTSEDVVAAVAELVPLPVPVILLSGDAGPEIEQIALRHHWSLLSKPVNAARLRALAVELTRDT